MTRRNDRPNDRSRAGRAGTNGGSARARRPRRRAAEPTPWDLDAPLILILDDRDVPLDEPLDGAGAGLSLRQLGLLTVVGAHPFLPVADLDAALRWEPSAVRATVDGLRERGLLRAVPAEEVDPLARAAGLHALEPLELTRAGGEVAATWDGLTLDQAVRRLGYAGGGPERPFGARAELLGDLAHTLGAHAFAVGLALDASRALGDGRDALWEWRSRPACRRGRLDPDGYVALVRPEGGRYDAFIEYETGATPDEVLRRKFASYRNYRDSGRFRRDDEQGDDAGCAPTDPRFPRVLVLAPDAATEERVAAAVRAAEDGETPELDVLLTHVGLLPECLAPWRRDG